MAALIVVAEEEHMVGSEIRWNGLALSLAILLFPSAAAADLACPSTSSSTLEANGLTPGNANTVHLGRLNICIFGCSTLLTVIENTGGTCVVRLVKYHGTSTYLSQLTKHSNICLGAGNDVVVFHKPTCNNVDVSSFTPWAYNGFSLTTYLEAGEDYFNDGAGQDIAYGGTDADSMTINDPSTNDFLWGESGGDDLLASSDFPAITTIQGGYGADYIYNNSTNSHSYGWFDSDHIDAYSAVTLDGGSQYDYCCPLNNSVWCEAVWECTS